MDVFPVDFIAWWRWDGTLGRLRSVFQCESVQTGYFAFVGFGGSGGGEEEVVVA